MTRTINLPSGRNVSLKTYVSAWKTLKAMNPETKIDGWCEWPTTARNILRDMRKGTEDRITQGISYRDRGIKKMPEEKPMPKSSPQRMALGGKRPQMADIAAFSCALRANYIASTLRRSQWPMARVGLLLRPDHPFADYRGNVAVIETSGNDMEPRFYRLGGNSLPCDCAAQT